MRRHSRTHMHLWRQGQGSRRFTTWCLSIFVFGGFLSVFLNGMADLVRYSNSERDIEQVITYFFFSFFVYRRCEEGIDGISLLRVFLAIRVYVRWISYPLFWRHLLLWKRALSLSSIAVKENPSFVHLDFPRWVTFSSILLHLNVLFLLFPRSIYGFNQIKLCLD